MSLVVKNLSYTYQPGSTLEKVALSDVSFSATPGSATLVAGATGSGKSTLLRLLSGLITPTGGLVELNGETPKPGSNIGIVFQRPEAQLFGESILADVMFGPKNMGASDEEAAQVAKEALSLVDLDPELFGERSPFALSGGEARRAAIAGVIAMRPPTILLDEPTAGLDWEGRKAIRALMGEFKKQGTTVIIVSHSAEDFLDIVDEALLLRHGKTVFCGSNKELVDNPSAFEAAGVMIPPLLSFQHAATTCGARLEQLSTDVDTVAKSILNALGAQPDGGAS